MGNIGNLDDNFDPNTMDYRVESGIGTASTLSMSDEEKEEAERNKRPIGFIWVS